MRIQGSGGSKPSAPKPRQPVEAPNTLQSKSTARLIDALCEGPIKGLINGMQSVYLDGTPIENPDGTRNFDGVTVETRLGEPDQEALGGFPYVEVEESVGVKLEQNTGVVRQITDPDTDALRIKLRAPAFTRQTSQGDLVGVTVQVRVEVQPQGGSYTEISSKWQAFSGNQSSNQAIGLRITAQSTVSGRVGSRQTKTITVEYRELGSGTWLELGSRTLTETIPSGTQSNGSAIVSATFDSELLTQGQYEIRSTNATIVSRQESVPAPIVISGKTTSAYEESHRIPLPADGAPWNVRLTRLTSESDAATVNDDLYWSTYTRIIDAKLSYPDTALAGVAVDAQQFGQEVVARHYEGEWREVRIPSNYDPETREYTGVWDGTFQIAYTNNPAWVLYDVISHSRYGLGEYIDIDQIDKFALYDIAQYCDELVDDGFGGQEPRFTMNCCINSQREAFDVINAIASGFRGMVYWGSGSVTAVQDSPTDPVKLVTPANVVDGFFDYSSTGLKARHSAALVTWNNPADGYKANIAVVEDPEMIAQFGWRSLDTVAFGCTSKGQAVRFGRWLLDIERNETETVTYEAGLDQFDLRPGDIIAIADPDYADVRFGGRVKTPGLSTLVIDQAVTLASGETYSLSVTMPNGEVVDRAITNAAGETDTLTLESDLPDMPVNGALWVITGTDVAPRKFRVLQVRETDKHTVQVTALLHDPNKYARVEQDLVLAEPSYSAVRTGQLEPPSSLQAREYLYQAGPNIKSAITFAWAPSTDPRVGFYETEYKGPEDNDYRFFRTTGGVSIDLHDTIKGLYSFRVRALDFLGGLRSQWVEMTRDFQGLAAKPSTVSNFNIQVIDGAAFLSWEPVTDLDLSHYVIKYSPALSGATWGSASVLFPRVSKDSTGVSLQVRVGTYLIKAVDTSSVESENASSIITTVAAVQGLNVVETLTESPGFAGEKTGVMVIDDTLRLGGADSVDDWVNVDLINNVDIGASGIESSGTYRFANSIDLGEVFTSRLTPTVVAFGSDLLSNVDEWTNVDLIENVDGGDPSKWVVIVQVRKTNTDPASVDPEVDPEGYEALWDTWQNLVVGDYTARAFEFQALLVSYQDGISPVITTLSVQIDMPDRTASGNDVVCPPGGTRVTFEPAFKATPAITHSLQSMQDRDRWVVSNQDATGFDIEFFDSSGTSVERTFDWQANGYGRVST